MKVLIVSEPGVDGVFRYVESLCDFLIAEGVEVHLAYSDRRGSDCLAALVARVAQNGGRTLNLRTANRPAPADGAAFRGLWRLARAVQPDVIHSHSSKAGFLARLLPLVGIRAIQLYSPHAYVGMRPVAGRLDWLYNIIEGALARMARTIVVSSDERAFASEHLRVPPPRLFLIPNGVDTRKFSPVAAPQKHRLRAALGLPADEPVLGFLGRSAAQKDPVTLYRAFARVATRRPATLFHVGRGELDAQLDLLVTELGIRPRVVRLPYLATPVDFYRAVDGFALCSHYEGFSLAALEALSADLPLILSAAPGNRDLLSLPLSHLWSAPPGDVDGFADAIARWRERVQLPAVSNHRRLAQVRCEARTSLGAVLRLYRQLAGARTERRRPWLRPAVDPHHRKAPRLRVGWPRAN